MRAHARLRLSESVVPEVGVEVTRVTGISLHSLLYFFFYFETQRVAKLLRIVLNPHCSLGSPSATASQVASMSPVAVFQLPGQSLAQRETLASFRKFALCPLSVRSGVYPAVQKLLSFPVILSMTLKEATDAGVISK